MKKFLPVPVALLFLPRFAWNNCDAPKIYNSNPNCEKESHFPKLHTIENTLKITQTNLLYLLRVHHLKTQLVLPCHLQ